MDEFCQERGFVKQFETSARENINIQKAFQCLIDEVNIEYHFLNKSIFVPFSERKGYMRKIRSKNP